MISNQDICCGYLPRISELYFDDYWRMYNGSTILKKLWENDHPSGFRVIQTRDWATAQAMDKQFNASIILGIDGRDEEISQLMSRGSVCLRKNVAVKFDNILENGIHTLIAGPIFCHTSDSKGVPLLIIKKIPDKSLLSSVRQLSVTDLKYLKNQRCSPNRQYGTESPAFWQA